MKKEKLTTQELICMMFLQEKEMKKETEKYLLDCVTNNENPDIIETKEELENAIKLVPQILTVLNKSQILLLHFCTLSMLEFGYLSINKYLRPHPNYITNCITIYINKGNKRRLAKVVV